MASTAMWTSKLCNKYSMASIQESDKATQKELKRLRSLRANHLCFDCGSPDNSWSSVDHGVFICVTCSDVHRSVGTHITKTKGCTGTYLWGPDELANMQTIGNQEGEVRYGTEKVSPFASKESKQQHVVDKYEKRLFVAKAKLAPQFAKSVAQKMNQLQQKSVPSEACRHPAKKDDRQIANSRAMGREIFEFSFDESFNDPKGTCLVDETQLDSIPTAINNVDGQKNNLDDFLDSVLLPTSTPATMNKTLLTSSANNQRKKTFGAMGHEISKALFDELFNDPQETKLVNEVKVTQPDPVPIASNNISERKHSLDDCFDSTLLPTTTATVNRTLLTSSANNRTSSKKTFAEDPFFDWEF